MDDPIRCRLPELIEKRGLTQITFAEKHGFSKQQLNAYCTMRRMMSIQTAKFVAGKLKVRIEDLYEWEDEQQE